MKKLNRTSIYISIILAATFSSTPANSIPIGFDSTNGTWNITATDSLGITWNESTLNFNSQTLSGSDFLLEGYFFWQSNNGAFGRENFTGTLFSNNTLELTGFELIEPTSGIITANYFAILNDSGTQFINGSWDGSGTPSNDWSASVSAVPIPSAIWLFGSGLVSLIGLGKKRSNSQTH